MTETLIRTVIMYFLLMAAVRIMGKRQIGDMQPGELVITIMISDLASIPLQDENQPVLTGIISVFTLVFLEILISAIALKSPVFRRFFYGNSAIIIKNGKPDRKMMQKLRITAGDLIEVLRNSGIFDLCDVDFAVLETNGQLSVMLKSEKQPATVENLKGTVNENSLPLLTVSDGKIISDNLKALGVSESLIKKKLKEKSIPIKDVFIMTCDQKGAVTVIKKEDAL